MAEIKEFLDQRAVKQIEDYLKSLGLISNAYDDIAKQEAKAAETFSKKYTESKKLETQINKRVKSTEELSKQQQWINTQAKESERINKGLATTSAKLNAAYSKENVKLQQKRKELSDVNKTIKVNNVLNSKNAGTLEKIEAANKKLRNERNKLNLTTKQGQKRLIEINKELDKNSEITKKSLDIDGKRIKNIGNYGSAFDGLKGKLGQANVAMKAFLANPVVAVIGAVVAVFALFKKSLSRSEEGQARLNKISRVFGAVLDVVLDVVTKLGIGIIDTFSKPKEYIKSLGDVIKKNITNRFESLGLIGKAVAKVFSKDWKEGLKDLGDGALQLTTGVEDLREKVSNGFDDGIEKAKEFGSKIDDNIKKAKQLADLEAELAKQERIILVDNAKLALESAKLRGESEDLKKLSAEEGIKALEKSFELDEQILAGELKLAETRADILRKQSALAFDDIAAKKGIADAEAAIFQAQTAFEEKRRERTRRLNIFRLEAFKQENDRRKNELELIKVNSNAIIAENQRVIDSETSSKSEQIEASKRIEDKKIQIINETFAIQVAALEKEKELKLKSEVDFQSEYELLLAKQNEAIRVAGDEQVKTVESINKKIAETESKAVQDKVKATIDRAMVESSMKDNILKTQLAKGLITQEQYEQTKIDLENESLQKGLANLEKEIDKLEDGTTEKIELLKKANDIKKELSDSATENELRNLEKEAERRKELQKLIVDSTFEAATLVTEALFEAQQTRLDNELATEQSRTTQELEELEKRKEAGLISESAYNLQKEKLNQDLADKEAAIKTKQAKNDKKAALISIAINTAKGIVAALGSANIPLSITVGILGAIQAGIVAAKPIPQFAKGTKNSPDTFIAGEAGRELMIHNGNITMAETPTLFTGMAGTQVISNKETERMLRIAGRDEPRDDYNKRNNLLDKIAKNTKPRRQKRTRRRITERRGFENYHSRIEA